MSFNATWSMAVGGMVGGGIFSVLGVVIATAGEWAWLSFVLAGAIALVSAYSYSQLSIQYQEGGGAFTFLREIDQKGLAGSLSWVLVLGYVLTVSVYAYTFGHYVAHVVGMSGGWLPRALAVAIIGALAFVNLRGVGDSARVEIITVWGKLFVLLGLAVFGLAKWDTAALTAGTEPRPWSAAILGAATIFMAYEGFQLLSYDYDDLKNPDQTLPRATLSAVVAVIGIYVVVTLGSVMLVGAETLVRQQEVALSIAGQQALGTAGLWLVTVAAAFSTGSAINATLFSTGRLMESVAKKKDLPDVVAQENKAKVPYYAILFLAGLAAALAVIGSLSMLVDAASLIFLLTFGTVNWLAFRQRVPYRWLCAAGAAGCAVAIGLSGWHQLQQKPWPLLVLIGLVLLAVFGRPYLLRKMRGESEE